MSEEKGLFTEDDLEILSQGVSLHPNLEYACFAAKMAKKHLTFPIMKYEEFDKLLALKKLPKRVAKRKIGRTHLRKFFPKELFPIEDAKDFLGKTLAALSWGDQVHYHEEFLKKPKRFARIHYRKEG